MGYFHRHVRARHVHRHSTQEMTILQALVETEPLYEVIMQPPFPNRTMVVELVGRYWPKMPQKELIEFADLVMRSIKELEDAYRQASFAANKNLN